MKRTLAVLGLFVCGCPESFPAPLANDAGAPDADTPPSWQPVLTKLDGALLSVWGTSSTDVYAVGGPLGNTGFSSLALHFDGLSWKRLQPGGTETYWWVYGTGANDVWMVGEKGRITHWDGSQFKELASGTTATLYGVWASAANDAWAVGGTPEGGAASPNDVVLHWDGNAWSPSPLPQAFGRTLFKVWGTASDNLYAVGEAGTIWHRTHGADGGAPSWTLESNPPASHGTLLTVFGCSATEVYAVGGRDVLRSDGKTWAAVTATLTNDVNGVACGPSAGQVVIVGFGGLKQRLVNGVWADDFGTPPNVDLHGAWADPSGAFWAGGGNFITSPAANVPRDGVLARFGRGTVSGTIAP